MSTTQHVLVFAALVTVLWLGGGLIMEFVGRYARTGFEFLLIFAYLHVMWNFPGRLRPPPGESDDGGRGPGGR
jgi:hypothetical protein